MYFGFSDYNRLHHWNEVEMDSDALEVTIWVSVPGSTSEDVDISLQDQLLSLFVKGPTIAGRDISYHREFKVPQDFNLEKIRAEIKHGLLKIVIPRSIPEKIKIEVKGSE